MHERELSHDGGHTYVLVCDKGDDAIRELEAFARRNQVAAASFTAIGAFRDVTLGYFDREIMDYRRNEVHEQVEVLSCIGDVAVRDGEPTVHAHVVVGRRDGTTRGGHLIESSVWPTLEVVLTETPDELRKTVDPQTGLALIDVARS